MTSKHIPSFTPEQRRSIHEVAELIGMYIRGDAALDAALFLAAIRARRSGVNSLDFVAIGDVYLLLGC